MLVKCPECGNSVSTLAASCPHCGAPLSVTESDTSAPKYHVPPPRPAATSAVPLQPPTGNKGIIAAGYICAFISLLLFPPGFGIAGLALGIIVLTKGNTGHGIAITVLSVTCGFFGVLWGSG